MIYMMPYIYQFGYRFIFVEKTAGNNFPAVSESAKYSYFILWLKIHHPRHRQDISSQSAKYQ